MAIIYVASDKDPDVKYEVDTDTGECQCPHYQKRLKEENAGVEAGERKTCKHYARAIATRDAEAA